MTDHADLHARIETATAGEDDLSRAIADALDVHDAEGSRRPFATCTDAALALVERFFPGAETAIYTGWALKRYGTQIAENHWSIPDDTPRGCWVRFHGGDYLGPLYNASCEAATPALAIVGALLDALRLQARMDTEDEPLSHRQARAEWRARRAARMERKAP